LCAHPDEAFRIGGRSCAALSSVIHPRLLSLLSAVEEEEPEEAKEEEGDG
jgi:hypothetical protein